MSGLMLVVMAARHLRRVLGTRFVERCSPCVSVLHLSCQTGDGSDVWNQAQMTAHSVGSLVQHQQHDQTSLPALPRLPLPPELWAGWSLSDVGAGLNITASGAGCQPDLLLILLSEHGFQFYCSVGSKSLPHSLMVLFCPVAIATDTWSCSWAEQGKECESRWLSPVLVRSGLKSSQWFRRRQTAPCASVDSLTKDGWRHWSPEFCWTSELCPQDSWPISM